MDGSFAFAFLLTWASTFVNLALLVFALSLFVFRRFQSWKRLLFSVAISVPAVAVAGFIAGKMVSMDTTTALVDELPDHTIPLMMMATILSGCSSFIYVLILAIRAKTTRFWSMSRWFLVPVVLLHLCVSAIAFYLTWCYTFVWFVGEAAP